MTAEIALGTIVPSGNRMVERMTQEICAKLAGVVPLFTRIPVFGDTSPDKAAAGPYDWPAMLKAAELLSDAGPGALCCNGSKRVAIAASTSTIASAPTSRPQPASPP
jgi:maleate isomerase